MKIHVLVRLLILQYQPYKGSYPEKKMKPERFDSMDCNCNSPFFSRINCCCEDIIKEIDVDDDMDVHLEDNLPSSRVMEDPEVLQEKDA